MAVVDGKGTPIGLLVANANPSEIKLAEATLATVEYLNHIVSPRTGPRSW